MTALPDLLKKQAEKHFARLCAQAAADPQQPRHLQTRYADNRVTLIEIRACQHLPGQQLEQNIAQFRYNDLLNQWTLHSYDQDGRWQLYLNINPSLDLGKLLQAVKDDPMGFFWD